VARELVAAGYHAIFGVDFVCTDGRAAVIETNPRMVASLPIATQLEIASGRAPLLLLQLLQGLNGSPPAAGPDNNLTNASQVIAHAFPDDIGGDLAAGVYRIGAGGPPRYLRPGCWLSDLEAHDEALLLPRAAGEPRTAGMEFARVYMKNSSGENQPGLRELVTQMRAASLPRTVESSPG
jgi:hypothetical protein